jgi:Tfp pilus assembly protein PilF
MTAKVVFWAVAGLVLAGAPNACRFPPSSENIRRGALAAESGRWDEASDRWRKEVAAALSSVAAHNNLAVAYEKCGRFEEAGNEYEAALRLDPANAAVQENFRKFKRGRRLEAREGRQKVGPSNGGAP